MSNEVAMTFTQKLAGRDVEFRRADVGQLIMLRRMAERQMAQGKDGTREQQAEAVSSAMARTLDFIETLMVNDDDKAFVEDRMLAGEITFAQLMGVLGGPGDDTPDDEEPKAKRAVRKSPKAAPAAKTVASRARTKR